MAFFVSFKAMKERIDSGRVVGTTIIVYGPMQFFMFGAIPGWPTAS